MQKDSYIIALAWPETWVKGTRAWYDPLAEKIGLSKEGHYKVGHAALVLLDPQKGEALYYDCGRYNCPPGLARIRSAETDEELTLKQGFKPEELESTNLYRLLDELQNLEATHGQGIIHWDLHAVNFHQAKAYLKQKQAKGHLKYGPFTTEGLNCSRLVLEALVAGRSIHPLRAKLRFWPCPFPVELAPQQFSAGTLGQIA